MRWSSETYAAREILPCRRRRRSGGVPNCAPFAHTPARGRFVCARPCCPGPLPDFGCACCKRRRWNNALDRAPAVVSPPGGGEGAGSVVPGESGSVTLDAATYVFGSPSVVREHVYDL